eukprot:scaffold22205_cov65-Attheya_sp.AAC.2
MTVELENLSHDMGLHQPRPQPGALAASASIASATMRTTALVFSRFASAMAYSEARSISDKTVAAIGLGNSGK